jgi:CBS domain-containing protein
MICPACSHNNLEGLDRCEKCESDLMQDDVPQPDTPIRWRVMVDPISSLEASTIAPQTVPSGTSLEAAVARMRERGIGYLLVTDTEGKLVGLLTEKELLRRGILSRADLDGRQVDELMQVKPTTLHASEPIAHALHFMALDESLYLPLVDDEGRPVDLLSFRRLARLFEHME